MFVLCHLSSSERRFPCGIGHRPPTSRRQTTPRLENKKYRDARIRQPQHQSFWRRSWAPETRKHECLSERECVCLGWTHKTHRTAVTPCTVPNWCARMTQRRTQHSPAGSQTTGNISVKVHTVAINTQWCTCADHADNTGLFKGLFPGLGLRNVPLMAPC